ncbi:MAG: CBS domain-containing protein [Bacteroidetes bacterium]|nr:CBS domain-containing protein [Bacteroidota bacterium]MCL5738951.1 CBS domain-containing protein [Bacteroidota bacterium]
MPDEELEDELKEMYEEPKRREKALSNDVLRLSLKALKLQNAISVSPAATVQEAVEQMQKSKIGCLLLVESPTGADEPSAQKKLEGIFTERDFLLKVAGLFKDLSSVPVSKFSTPDPETLRMDDPIGFALHLMHVGGYRHVPVVNEKNEPVAVLSIKDVVSFLSEYFPEDVLNQPPKPLRSTSEREGA